jgi:D-inositol-3-phosphate glycosyltransferase
MNILYVLPLSPEAFSARRRSNSDKLRARSNGFADYLARGVKLSRHHPTLVYLSSKRSVVHKINHMWGFPVYLVPKTSSLSFPNELSLSILKFIGGLHKKSRFDLMHIHSYYLAMTAPLVFIARRFGIPVVVQYHGGRLNPLNPASWIKFLPLRWALQKTASVFIPTPQQEVVLTRWLGVPQERIHIIPSGGLDAEVFFPQERGKALSQIGLDAKKRYLLFVGRLHKRKGIWELIHAFSKLKEEFPDLRLLVVGGTKEEVDKLAGQIKRLDFAKDVVITGWVPHESLRHYYSSAECLVLPSYSDAQPLVILEAWACRCPVVASRVGGIPYVLKGGKTGLLVPPRDVDSLVQELRSILTDDLLQHRLAENGYFETTQKYTWEKIAVQLIHLYGEILSRQG